MSNKTGTIIASIFVLMILFSVTVLPYLIGGIWPWCSPMVE